MLIIWRSFAVKLMLLVAVFVAVPALVYRELKTADEGQQAFLLKSVQDRGRLIAEALRPLLLQYEANAVPRLGAALGALVGTELKTKILFRPAGATGPDNFYYVASTPPVPTEYLEVERANLLKSGVFDLMRDSCQTFASPAIRYTNPSGEEEVLASIVPMLTRAGCWVVVTSSSAEDILGSSIGQPYWKTPQLRAAAVIYVLMALFVIWMFADGWRSLLRFADVARRIRTRGAIDGAFADSAIVPELAPVAREFDGLVAALEGSARMIRYAAEDNAHAFKTPIAAIAQSIEALKRSVPPDDARGRRSVALIEQALQRLDGLVSAARRMDEVAAELLDPPRGQVDLHALIRRIAEDYADTIAESGRRLVVDAATAAKVRGAEDLIETVVENLLDNAEGFSPPGGEIRLALAVEGRSAVLTVDDQGPGVDPAHLEHIFDRYFSYRKEAPGNGGAAAAEPDGAHFGIGLWVVRRNVEALGGSVAAENRTPSGLRVRVALPLL